MRKLRVGGVAWLAMLAGFLLPGDAARACSVCLAGDPTFDSQGAGVQEAGNFTAYLEVRGYSKKSGALPGEEPAGGIERSQSTRISMLMAWTPLDRLTLSVEVPFVANRIGDVEEEGTSHISAAGLGDVTSSASFVLWRNRDVLPSTLLEARAFLKSPTGKSHETTEGVVDKHVQPGTGSWDFGFGLAGTQRLNWGTLYASALYRENTQGSLNYRYGDVALANLAALAPLGHLTHIPDLDRLTLGLELNFRYAQKDHFEGGKYQDSGGSILYLTPSLRFRVPWLEGRMAPSLRAGVQIPLTDAWLYGFQREGEVWNAGVLFSF
jgi:hypothetical protein